MSPMHARARAWLELCVHCESCSLRRGKSCELRTSASRLERTRPGRWMGKLVDTPRERAQSGTVQLEPQPASATTDSRHMMSKPVHKKLKLKSPLKDLSLMSSATSSSQDTLEPLASAVVVLREWSSVAGGWQEYIAKNAVKGGHVDVLKWTVLPSAPAGTLVSLLSKAAELGHLDVVQWHHEQLRQRGHEPRCDGDCSLLVAIQRDHFNVARYLADNGYELRDGDDISSCAKFGNLEMIKWLHSRRLIRGDWQAGSQWLLKLLI
ncbi:hypothetical protein PybrP1_010075 [[Pythium] brassicae (nom. inval.)]|nr:hypothetical protein PybrP1_010075 [[Pythium] brassicae (nom. inval.)]